MEVIDCTVDGKSFSLDVDEPSPEIQQVANIVETRGSRTTRESIIEQQFTNVKMKRRQQHTRSCVPSFVATGSPSILDSIYLHMVSNNSHPLKNINNGRFGRYAHTL